MLNQSQESKALGHKHFFSFTLTSPLFRMSLNKANRIYTDKTILEVIQTTLEFYKEDLGKNLDFSPLHLTYPKLELITQYNESDLEFITRLAHNNGIYFYEDEQSIYFKDLDSHSLEKRGERWIVFNPKSNNTLNEPCISSLYKQQTLRANHFTQSSQNASNPFALESVSLKSALSLQETSEESSLQERTYNEHNYLSESSFSQRNDFKTPLSLKEKRLQVLHHCFKAQSNIYDLFLNQQIKMDFSQSIQANKIQEKEETLKDFTIIGMEHFLLNESLLANNFNSNDYLAKRGNAFLKENLETNKSRKNPLKEETISSPTTKTAQESLETLNTLGDSPAYSNLLTLLPLPFYFTPSLKHKPKAPSSTLGIVIGASEEIQKERNTIHTDRYGRVRVRINCFASQEILDNKRAYNRENETQNEREIQGETQIQSKRERQENVQERNQETKRENPTQENLSLRENPTSLDSNNDSTQQTKAYSYHYSPYLRVSSPIANLHSGFFHTPRVGDEVIISFLDEDIDKPYVSASLYSQSNAMPQYNYPRHKREIALNTLGSLNTLPHSFNQDLEPLKFQENTEYQLKPINFHYLTLANSTIGVENADAKARNEITLKNDKDKEEIYILAQKDYKEEIGNNYEQTIQKNKVSEVGAFYTEFITKGHLQNIV
nr:contractile injection system protein, VgrG/Pvc8 family [Helicobacter sp.]